MITHSLTQKIKFRVVIWISSFRTENFFLLFLNLSPFSKVKVGWDRVGVVAITKYCMSLGGLRATVLCCTQYSDTKSAFQFTSLLCIATEVI